VDIVAFFSGKYLNYKPMFLIYTHRVRLCSDKYHNVGIIYLLFIMMIVMTVSFIKPLK